METTNLGTQSITKLMIKLSIPMILAQIVNLLYNLVDRIYIGNLDEIGDIALGGVGMCFPIIIIIGAFSALFGMGGAPLASIKLGEKKQKEAENILNNSFWLLIITALIITPIMLIFKEPILTFFGANDENIQYANDYLNIYIIGTIFVMLALGLNQYMSCQGFSKIAMITITIGAVLNIVLDPIFIFGLNMGVKGAALATILSQGISCIFVIWFFKGKQTAIKINFFKFTLNKNCVKSICLLGISPFIMQSTEALVQISFNNQIKAYFPNNTESLYLTSMTILISLMALVNMPLQGLSQGCQPIISYNYGAKNFKRVKQTARRLILVSVIFSFLVCGVLILFPEVFIRIFSNNQEMIEITKPLMKIFFVGMLFMGLQTACQICFLAVGRSGISVCLAALRKIVLLIPLTFILPLFMDSDGIYYAEMVSDLLAIAITCITFILFFPKILKLEEAKIYNAEDKEELKEEAH